MSWCGAGLAPRRAFAWIVAASAVAAGCGAGAASPPPGQTPGTVAPARDTGTPGLVPAGFGSLRQDDISLLFQLRGLLVRATPLEESVIRLLAPDSYRALRDLRERERDRIADLATRYGVRGFSVWNISFFALEPDVAFSPMDVTISSLGRDLRPIQLIPLTAGFGQNRLQQRTSQYALYLFDDAVDVTQPLALTVETTRNTGWDEILRVIERETSSVRSRAAGAAVPPPG